MKTARVKILSIPARPAPIVGHIANLQISIVAAIAIVAASAVFLQVLP